MTPVNRLRSFARDHRGVAAVEFALLAPLLITIYFGLVEVCSGYMAQKRMSHATALIADLVAQEEVVNTSNLADITAIGALIMKPFAVAPLGTRISSVTQTSAGSARVNWSWGHGMDARADNEIVFLPPDVVENGQSVIMSESTYRYDSPIKKLLPKFSLFEDLTTFGSVYYLRPRITATTDCSDC